MKLQEKDLCPYCKSGYIIADPISRARAEVAKEVFRESVEVEKTRMLNKTSWFPWRLTITKV